MSRPTSRFMRPTPSTSSFASTSTSTHHSGPAASSSSSEASVAIFRQLDFVASVPIQFVLGPPTSFTTNSTDSPIASPLSTELQSYLIQVPRITYLPLVFPTLQKQFFGLAVNDPGTIKQVWFQDEQTREFLKPHWPIGLMYDYHHSSNHHALPPASSSTTGSDPPVVPPSSDSNLASVFAAFDSPSLLSPPSFSSSSSTSEYRPSNPVNSIPNVTDLSPSTTRTILDPWRIIVHLTNPTSTAAATTAGAIGPPNTPVSMNVTSEVVLTQECKQHFMNRLKESDYLRYGNSKKKLVNLRKDEQDSLWIGILNNDFVKFWSVGNKLIPLPSTTSSTLNTTTATSSYEQSISSTPNKNGVGTGADGDLKNLAIKVYLPPVPISIAGESSAGVGGGEGKVLNSPTSPLDPQTGQPITLQTYLSDLLPLLFPPPSGLQKTTMTRTSTSQSTITTSSDGTRNRLKAFPIIQGVIVPLESELSWLASCLGGMDGWLSIVIAIRE